jgi:hypothetical protein
MIDQSELQIPQEWKDELAKLREVCPSAIIAGGCLRDLYCGRAPKDIDFFALPPEREMPFPWVGSDMDYEGMEYVLAVLTRHDKAPPLNLIFYDGADSVNELLESFDFGLCQIAFDGFNTLVTPAFLWDFKYGVFTMRHTDRIERSKLRYERINQRYGWPLHIIEEKVNA